MSATNHLGGPARFCNCTFPPPFNRRDFIRATLASTGALAAANLGLTKAAAAGDSTLVVGVVAEPVTLDTAQNLSHSDAKLAVNLFNGLVGQEVGSYKIVPALAQSWKTSPDGLSYLFTLRPNVKFHDGTNFDAAAAKFSIDRQIDENHPYHKMGTFPYRKNRLGKIREVEVVDPMTLRIGLTEPFAPFIDYLASEIVPMVSPTAVAKLNDRFGASPVGTGPFKLLRWDKGQRIILERNANYWGGAPRLDRIVSVTYVEPQARVAALQTGEAQLIEGVPLDFVEALSQDPRFQRITGPSPHVWYVVLNTRRGPLQDIRVRRAMNHAVDKTRIVRDVLRGFPTIADGPLSRAFADYQTDLVKYEYDPQKARDLLTEAGHPNGFELVFSIAESGTGMQEPVSMATVIQANLAAVGIKVTLQTFEWGAYQSIRTSGNFDMAAFSWTPGIGNPDVILYSKFHRSQFPPNGYNNAFWGSEQVDRMLEEARTTSDNSRRIELYKSVQKLIVQGASHIWVDHDINQVLAADNLRGFKVHPTSDFYISPDLFLA